MYRVEMINDQGECVGDTGTLNCAKIAKRVLYGLRNRYPMYHCRIVKVNVNG
jgi:hypothetical protein